LCGLDSKTLELDLQKTEEMRKAKMKERIAQGIPAKEYVKKMVEKRKSRKLPNVVLNFFDSLLSLDYSGNFKKELEFEQTFAATPMKTKMESVNGGGKMVLELTPHVNVLEAENGKKHLVCSHCEHPYCDVHENYKLYCLVYDRDPREIRPEIYRTRSRLYNFQGILLPRLWGSGRC